MHCRILLVGLMGSGKTSVGRLLAERLGWPYHDNDALVEAAAGMTARQIVAGAGETALRAAESDALALGAGMPEPCIVGVAAGTVLGPADRRLMTENGIVFWLTADPATLADRATGSIHRPWLQEEAEAWLRETAAERHPLYTEVARHIIDTQDRTPEEVAELIVGELADESACAPWLPPVADPAG